MARMHCRKISLLRLPRICALGFGLIFSCQEFTKAEEVDGQGLVCVGVMNPGADLHYGFIFYNGRVKALSIIGGKLYVPGDNEDVRYEFTNSGRIEWNSTNSLHETYTPSSGFTHSIDKGTLKHSVTGGKEGFKGGLCFFDSAVGVKVYLLQKAKLPRG